MLAIPNICKAEATGDAVHAEPTASCTQKAIFNAGQGEAPAESAARPAPYVRKDASGAEECWCAFVVLTMYFEL